MVTILSTTALRIQTTSLTILYTIPKLTTTTYFQFELPSDIAKLLYINSCHGLSCLFGSPNVFILWNSLIRKLMTLSEPSLPNRIGDTVLCWYAHGLGFDQLNNNYKVVRLVYFIREGDTYVGDASR